MPRAAARAARQRRGAQRKKSNQKKASKTKPKAKRKRTPTRRESSSKRPRKTRRLSNPPETLQSRSSSVKRRLSTSAPRARTLAQPLVLSRQCTPRKPKLQAPTPSPYEIRKISDENGYFKGKRWAYHHACRIMAVASQQKNEDYQNEHKHKYAQTEEDDSSDCYFEDCSVEAFKNDFEELHIYAVYQRGKAVAACAQEELQMKVGKGKTRYEASVAHIECFGIELGLQGKGAADEIFQAILTNHRAKFDVVTLECIGSAKTQWFYHKNKMALLCPTTNAMVMGRFFRNTNLVHHKKSLYQLFKGAIEKYTEENIEPPCGSKHVLLFLTA